MLSLDLYIRAAAAIAPEGDPGKEVVRLSVGEPDYSGIIPPMQLRRMSKAVRMGVGAAHECLLAARIEKPDAIIVGTALGCLADTEVFLRKLVEQDEQMLTPTAFIQSTHNTVAGQIALGTGCRGYNNTIVQHGHSFEGAVIAAALHLAGHPEAQVLCGGVDEMTDTLLGLMQRVGVYTSKPCAPGSEEHTHRGMIAGEGAGFLLLTKEASRAHARITGLSLFSATSQDAAGLIHTVLSANGGLRNADVLLTGASSDWNSAAAYTSPLDQGVRYRKRSGAWGTDTAIAIARLVNAWPDGKDRAWIVSHWGTDWTIWLLERV